MASVLGIINESAAHVDLSSRFHDTTVVAASPALAAETIVASLTILDAIQQTAGIRLQGMAAFTVGTSGVGATLRIRETNVSGSVVASSGAVTVVAADLYNASVVGFDTAGVLPGQTYVLTLQVASGAAASTVSAVWLGATVI
jgi:hypothetical protein